jgi:hypothetical protein
MEAGIGQVECQWHYSLVVIDTGRWLGWCRAAPSLRRPESHPPQQVVARLWGVKARAGWGIAHTRPWHGAVGLRSKAAGFRKFAVNLACNRGDTLAAGLHGSEPSPKRPE